MSTKRMSEIEALAASILADSSAELQRLGFSISVPPVPIAEICILRGLSVNSQVNLHYESMKLAGMLDALQKAVYYEARDILGRQHFSIAHELGHYVIHWPEVVRKLDGEGAHDVEGQFVDLEDTFTRYFEGDETTPLQSGVLFRIEGKKRIVRSQRMETEANYFAQFIMLPERTVLNAVETIMGLPYETAKHVLAHQFEVSVAAMDLRLRQLGVLTDFEHSYERKFFLDLEKRENGDPEPAISNTTPTHTITFTPQSRLRTLIAGIDQFNQPTDQIIIDFQTFHGADLNLFGVAQAVDLALLNDYIVDKYGLELENDGKSVRYVMPVPSSHIVRHMSRLGLSSQLSMESSSGQYLVDPQAVITGNHILLKLTPINSSTDFETLALHVRNYIVEWLKGITDRNEFADLAAKLIFQLTRDVVLYGSDSPGSGVGYAAVELQNIYAEGAVVGYRVCSTVGDIGISMMERLRKHFGTEFSSNYDAIEAYCCDHVERASLIQELVIQGGYVQINSGDVQYHIGRGSKNFFTGLHQVPGLQTTVVLSVTLKQG